MENAPDYGEKSYRGAEKLNGKTAIITGGDSGIGRAVALAFAREGADVIVSYLNETEDAAETRRIVEDDGRRCLLVEGDIGEESQCKKIVEQALDEFGKIDILVNAVAPGPVWTPLIPSTMPSEQVEKFGQDSPMKRPAQPCELAPDYVFLASDDASYISGEILGVTGGKPLP